MPFEVEGADVGEKEDDEVFANGEGRLVCLVDGNRFGRGDMGAIGG